MNDRELLELAAKAVGYEVAIAYQPDVPRGLYVRHEDKTFVWMPLIDDADALRLAVKLGLFVNVWLEAKQVYVDFAVSKKDVLEPFGNDPYAATRRAIVRAAAEIGRGTE
jgi:hypothetical protein